MPKQWRALKLKLSHAAWALFYYPDYVICKGNVAVAHHWVGGPSGGHDAHLHDMWYLSDLEKENKNQIKCQSRSHAVAGQQFVCMSMLTLGRSPLVPSRAHCISRVHPAVRIALLWAMPDRFRAAPTPALRLPSISTCQQQAIFIC